MKKKVENRISQSRFFYTNYFLKNDENGTDTFKLLFTLPISVRNWLKEKYVGADVSSREHDMQLLSSMPKTELHCHLGGVLNPAEMVEVALSVKDEVEALKKRNKVFAQWLVEVADLASTPSKGWKEWRAEACKACFGNSEGSSDEDQALVVPAFLQLFENDVERLKRLVFGKYCDDEKEFRGITIAKYEALGDLQGSALLRHEKTLRKNIQVLLRNCHQHHVHYLEIRCTLPNYERVGLSKEHLVNVLLDELEKENDIKISLLFIASRHKTKVDIEELFHWVRGLQQNELFMKYFRGYDVAGDESLKKPEELRSAFCNAFQDCPNVTIHAGEDVDCENIWQAIYHLNAERIGHGLTLEDNHNLYRKVIERRIGVEMCPSSNAQIVGYRDNYIVGDEVKEYPLKRFLDGGLRVCVNTDDPGISLTNPTNERLMAGRLTKGGISLWDLLQMEYHALCAAFYPYEKKTLLMKDFEKKIQDWISENYNGNNR